VNWFRFFTLRYELGKLGFDSYDQFDVMDLSLILLRYHIIKNVIYSFLSRLRKEWRDAEGKTEGLLKT
jgi:hypothetical protein